MHTTPQRKQCMELSGGRLTYDGNYEMPGLAMHVSSRRADHGLHGGGEVHFISSCASGRITRMMLADICGSADVFWRLSQEIRHGLMRSINSLWQHRVVSEMTRQFHEFAHQGGFATASVATFFAPTRSFAMCNIGNPPPLVFRAADRSWRVLHGETRGPCQLGQSPEGVFSPGEYRHIKTNLDVDDIVVMYGNGFAQLSFPDGNLVGHNRLLEALQDSPHTDARSRVHHLIRLILDINEPREDSTVFICQASDISVRLRDNLLAPLRFFRRPQDATALT